MKNKKRGHISQFITDSTVAELLIDLPIHLSRSHLDDSRGDNSSSETPLIHPVLRSLCLANFLAQTDLRVVHLLADNFAYWIFHE